MSSSVILASFPSPDRGVWYLGSIPIRAYALCIIAGIVVAIWWGSRRFVARGGQEGAVLDISVFAVPFGIVGGRLYHVITDHWRYFGAGKNPLNALKIWEGGLGIWGAIALGGVGALIGCRRRGVPFTAFADSVAPGIVVAQAIGRLGNYFNQELYGAHTTLPWAMKIYQRFDPNNPSVPATGTDGVAFGHIQLPDSPVHPTFLYELLWNLGVAAMVVWADRRFRLGHGRAFALYVAGYTAGRTWIELMRTDDATHVFGVRINVFVSGVVFLAAMAYFVVARSRGEREDLAALSGPTGPDAGQSAATAGDADGEKPEAPEETERVEEAQAEAEHDPDQAARPATDVERTGVASGEDPAR